MTTTQHHPPLPADVEKDALALSRHAPSRRAVVYREGKETAVCYSGSRQFGVMVEILALYLNGERIC
jgi:hypothetical protein